jgi:hypothetical protein
MTTESLEPGNRNSLLRRLLRVGGALLTLFGIIFAVVKYGGEFAKGTTNLLEFAKTVGVWKPPSPAPEKHATKDKELTTGSLSPRAAPAAPPPPCIPERDPGDIISTLHFHQDPQPVFAQLYRGRRVCPPGWALTVAALPQKLDDGTWRVLLSSGFAGVWVVMDTRSDISFLRPEQRVRVEGVVLNFSPQRFLKAGAVHIGTGRLAKQ